MNFYLENSEHHKLNWIMQENENGGKKKKTNYHYHRISWLKPSERKHKSRNLGMKKSTMKFSPNQSDFENPWLHQKQIVSENETK